MFPLLAVLACTDTPADDTATSLVDTAVSDYDPPPECPTDEGLSYRAPVAPNVMLVVDRSGSMDLPAPGCTDDCPSRWEALMSLAPVVHELGTSTRAGLTLYPDSSGGCEMSRIDVPIGEGTGDAILGELAAVSPDGKTPLADALTLIRTEGRVQDPYRDNMVILITDGVPSCRAAASSVTAAGRLADDGVQLHVISFADEFFGGTEILSEIAAEAHATSGPDNYHEATSIEGLLARLQRVTASLDTCAFAMDEALPASVTVTVNGVEQAACESEDCVEGYSLDRDANVIRLAPSTCRDIAGQTCPDVLFEAE